MTNHQKVQQVRKSKNDLQNSKTFLYSSKHHLDNIKLNVQNCNKYNKENYKTVNGIVKTKPT